MILQRQRLAFATTRAFPLRNSSSFAAEGRDREQVVINVSFSLVRRQKSSPLMFFQSSIYFCKVRCIDMRVSPFFLWLADLLFRYPGGNCFFWRIRSRSCRMAFYQLCVDQDRSDRHLIQNAVHSIKTAFSQYGTILAYCSQWR